MFWTLVGALIFVFWILPMCLGLLMMIFGVIFSAPPAKVPQKSYKADREEYDRIMAKYNKSESHEDKYARVIAKDEEPESELMKKARTIGERK